MRLLSGLSHNTISSNLLTVTVPAWRHWYESVLWGLAGSGGEGTGPDGQMLLACASWERPALAEVVCLQNVSNAQEAKLNGRWPPCFVLLFEGQSVVSEALVTPFQDRTFVFELYPYCYNFSRI